MSCSFCVFYRSESRQSVWSQKELLITYLFIYLITRNLWLRNNRKTLRERKQQQKSKHKPRDCPKVNKFTIQRTQSQIAYRHQQLASMQYILHLVMVLVCLTIDHFKNTAHNFVYYWPFKQETTTFCSTLASKTKHKIAVIARLYFVRHYNIEVDSKLTSNWISLNRELNHCTLGL